MPDRKVLPETEIMSIVDEVCEGEFRGYGIIAEFKGERRLRGKGLETPKEGGLGYMGGDWPTRFQNMCNQYLGEITDEEIYQAYIDTNKILKNFLCYGTGITGDCTRHFAKKKEKEELLKKESEALKEHDKDNISKKVVNIEKGKIPKNDKIQEKMTSVQGKESETLEKNEKTEL